MHKSGDLVRESGVYVVLHSTPHMLIERQICIEGSTFRGCSMCPLGLLYKLEKPSCPYIFADLTLQGMQAS